MARWDDADRRQADLNPPLGYPGGSCHLQDRIRQEIRNPSLEHDLIENHLSGKDKKPQTQAEHAIYDELPEGPVRGTSFRKVVFDEHAQYRMDQRGVTIPEVFAVLREFQKEWAKERSRGDMAKTRLLQQPREFEIQHKGLVVMARPLTFFDPKSNPNPVLRIRTVFPTGSSSVGKPTDNCPTFEGWSREYPEHGLDRILPARVAARYVEAIRTPPVPGVKTLVTDKSEKGLPTDIDREKQVALPPGSATPGGEGRVIPRFEYNTPDADSDIQPRTLGLPGDQYGHPVKEDYGYLTMRTMTSAEIAVRTTMLRLSGWMRFKDHFPGVRSPLFHATTGPRAANIVLRGEGLKADSGFSNYGGQVGMSTSRDLGFLLGGDFGKVILVFDRADLERRFRIEPVQHPTAPDEYEERVYADRIPASLIRGVILNFDPLRSEIEEWRSAVDIPVVYREGYQGPFIKAAEATPMDKEAYKQRWRPGKRQRRSRGRERQRRKKNYRKNRQKRKRQSRRWRQRNKNKSSFKRSQKRRRTQNRRRRMASVTRVAHAHRDRMASVLTVPDIAFLIGPEEYLGYVHSISPMTGMVTIELDDVTAPPLDSLPVELLMRMAVFLTEEDIDAFYDLVDVEIGPEAYAELDEDLVRDCARRYDRDPDADDFREDCFAASGEYALDAMSADQLDAITQGIIEGFTEGGHARSLEDADNEDIPDEYAPPLFYGEVNVER